MFALGSNAKCDVQASSSAVPLASLSIRSPSPARAFASTATDWSLVNLPEQLRTLSSQLKNGDVFGIRSLLDLLFLIAFGSFDAVKV
jgi:hypothetical protein